MSQNNYLNKELSGIAVPQFIINSGEGSANESLLNMLLLRQLGIIGDIKK